MSSGTFTGPLPVYEEHAADRRDGSMPLNFKPCLSVPSTVNSADAVQICSSSDARSVVLIVGTVQLR